MMNYGDKLRAMGLTDSQIGIILSGWRCSAIESLLRGEIEPPSEAGIVAAMSACGGMD